MHPKQFALVGGIVMLVMGALAFVPSFSVYPDWLPVLNLETSYGLFLGLFAMNVVNKVALIAFGIAGILASRAPTTNLPASINFSRWVLFVMAPLAVLGLIPQTSLLGGYWPLFGYNVAAAGVFAVLGAYFGFALPMKAKKALPQDRSRIRAA